MFIQRLRMGGLLSFPPDMEFFELQPLNVLIRHRPGLIFGT